jgi:hypothetical protein
MKLPAPNGALGRWPIERWKALQPARSQSSWTAPKSRVLW